MKFGDTLRSRSIPEWGHYNIDYDYLKDRIKHQTTPGTNKAVSIPGQGESTERVFRETFLQVLQAQHDRINLFIRSKSGEIERRLDHISKSLVQLRAKHRNAQPGARLPARTVERYAKIDADVTKSGEEIRSLSRFQGAQRTGFTKILKKYKRWTKDKCLSQVFKEEVSSHPDSLFQLDLGYLLDQYIDVLSALRAVFDGDEAPSDDYRSAHAQSAAARISKTLEQGDELDFDLALSAIPLGSNGNKTTYWIHPDHVVEAQVLLLQQMRLYTGNTKHCSRNESANATPGRRQSSGANIERYFVNEDDVGLLVLDHAEGFAIKLNASTIGSSEATQGNTGIRAVGNVRCVSSGAAAVVICPDSDEVQRSTNSIVTARMEIKSLQAVLGTDVQSGEGHGKTSKQLNDKTNGDDHSEIQAVQRWLEEHKQIKPIAGVGSKRTRFIGLRNNSTGGIWATLDRDVFMKDSLAKDLLNENWPAAARSNAIQFPHAILEVRREGAQATSLIQTLDRSHLVERVRGFSIEAHAVWMCCKPIAMTTPLWLPLLDQDIRKLPEPVKRKSRKSRSSTAGSVSQSSPPYTSTSNTSYDGQLSPLASRNGESFVTSAQEFEDPPPLEAFRKKRRKPFSDYPPPISSVDQEPEVQRYWNEYDHPEDEDAGGYYIYVDPDAPVKFPGQETIEAWIRRARGLLGLRNRAEVASLLSAAEDGSTDDEYTADESPRTHMSNYGTLSNAYSESMPEGYFSGLFRSLRDPHRDAQALHQECRSLLSELETHQHKTEMTKLRFYSTCLAMSIAIDVILGLMTVTSRKNVRGTVDIGVLFGTICTLMLCVVAIISMKTRKERLGWAHQGAVMTIAGAIVAFDVLLLFWVVRI